MKNTDLSEPILRLIERFEAWDQTFSQSRGADDAGLPSRERGALLKELLTLAVERPRGPRPLDPWRVFADLFGPRAASGPAERARREGRLLRAYEQLCEHDLPFDVSSVLLRHYSAIKRASHTTNDERQSPPTPARGTVVLSAMSLPAVPARVVAR